MTQISRRTFIRRMAVGGGSLVWLCTGIEFAHAAGPELAAGTLRRVRMPGAPLRRSWYLLERDTGTQLPEAAAFRDFCRSRDARAAVLAAIRPAAPSLVPGS